MCFKIQFSKVTSVFNNFEDDYFEKNQEDTVFLFLKKLNFYEKPHLKLLIKNRKKKFFFQIAYL